MIEVTLFYQHGMTSLGMRRIRQRMREIVLLHLSCGGNDPFENHVEVNFGEWPIGDSLDLDFDLKAVILASDHAFRSNSFHTRAEKIAADMMSQIEEHRKMKGYLCIRLLQMSVTPLNPVPSE